MMAFTHILFLYVCNDFNRSAKLNTLLKQLINVHYYIIIFEGCFDDCFLQTYQIMNTLQSLYEIL